MRQELNGFPHDHSDVVFSAGNDFYFNATGRCTGFVPGGPDNTPNSSIALAAAGDFWVNLYKHCAGWYLDANATARLTQKHVLSEVSNEINVCVRVCVSGWVCLGACEGVGRCLIGSCGQRWELGGTTPAHRQTMRQIRETD